MDGHDRPTSESCISSFATNIFVTSSNGEQPTSDMPTFVNFFNSEEQAPSANDMAYYLEKREALSVDILQKPYDLTLYAQRSAVYAYLCYPDLAAMDIYKVMLLVDEILDEAGEWHEEAVAAACDHVPSARNCNASRRPEGRQEQTCDDELRVEKDEAQSWAQQTWGRDAPILLAFYLADIGCLRTAYTYVKQALGAHPSYEPAQECRLRILNLARAYYADRHIPWDENDFDTRSLPDIGMVRREVYPWNHHEENRTSSEALNKINQDMSLVAPKLEVRMTELPCLSPSPGPCNKTIKQLGLFAKEDLAPGEVILHERSLLTANNRLKEPLCDACSATLPTLTNPRTDEPSQQPVPCPNCEDIIFCSAACLRLAQSYHPSVCGVPDLDALAKDVAPHEAADALYTQLLLRALAMSLTQDTHPLDLKEVKYIWGDFTVPSASRTKTLPFTFQSSILTPLHFLSALTPSHSPFAAPHDAAELWVCNTLLAKFRGTASARLSVRDGRPEVAAVHPLWCLANHACDPNVRWEWGGEMEFAVREGGCVWKRGGRRGAGLDVGGLGGVGGEGGEESQETEVRSARQGGIRAGEEILNHYVDVELPVQARREWGMGPLGGVCMCERCVWESSGSGCAAGA